MSDETMYDSGENYESQFNDVTYGDENNFMKEDTPKKEDSKGKKSGLATAGIAAGAGVAGAAGGVLFSNLASASEEGGEADDITPEEDLEGNPDEIQDEIPVDEVEEQVTDPLIGHTMPVAHGVNDDMSFNEAFAAARHEVGPGGLFEWHGQVYGTYYGNEWDAMSDADKDQYWADVNHTGYMAHNGSTSGNEGNDTSLGELAHHGSTDTIEPNDPMALNIDESRVIEEYDLDADGTPDVALVNANDNDIPDVIMDTTGDGHYDTLVVDPMVDEEGNLVMADNAIHEFDQINIVNDDNTPIEVEPGIVGPEPFETGVLTFNESEVYNSADLDGDGVADALIVDADGNESLDLVLDTTGDGNLDTLILDPGVDAEGNLVYDEGSVMGIGGVMITPDENLDMPDDTYLADNQNVDDLASVDIDPDVTIDNNMNMDDFA